ncbi:MAG: VOC family protein [Candidatus Bathyarchaeia archaeon]
MSQLDFKLDPGLKLGPICLRVNDLELMLSFYERECGLKVIQRDGSFTALVCGQSKEPILILDHDEKALKPPADAAGLYHYALLVPDRKSLAATYLSLGNNGIVFDGYADHNVSEALYLSDPEGNGIEIYADRPRSDWKFDEGEVQMATQPLDLDSLIKEVPKGGNDKLTGIPEGTRVGHVHLKVTDLQTSITFYRNILGFELMSYLGSAAFLSVGGYHHHIGMNTWESLGGSRAQKSWLGMDYFVLNIPQSNLNELSSRLRGNLSSQSDEPGKLFVSDPDDINLIFSAF